MKIYIKVENGENIYKKEALSFESAVEDIYKLQRAVEAREEELDEELVEEPQGYPDDYYGTQGVGSDSVLAVEELIN